VGAVLFGVRSHHPFHSVLASESPYSFCQSPISVWPDG
jgi:hypothetical protein